MTPGGATAVLQCGRLLFPSRRGFKGCRFGCQVLSSCLAGSLGHLLLV